MHQKSFEAYIAACSEVGINPNRIMQTIGGAKASAGTHAKDGEFTLKLSNGGTIKVAYAACTDIRSKDLNEEEIYSLLRALAKRGICAFWRHTGSFANNQHIHFIWAGCYMKRSVQRQIQDFLQSLDGLAYHKPEPYWSKHPIGKETSALIRKLFSASNPIMSLSEEEENEEDYICGCNFKIDNGETVPDDEFQGVDEEPEV